MSFLDRFLGRPGESIRDPDALRERLYEAVAREDAQALVALCAANRKLIRASFDRWCVLGPEIAGDPRRVEQHGHRLNAIARCLADRLGDRSLLARFQAKSPGPRWVRELEQADGLKAKHRFEDALALLLPLENDLKKWSGIPAVRMRGLVAGRIGHCLFQTLQAEAALARFEESSDLCGQADDQQGIRVHLGNRIEALRWLDRHREAAPLAARLADLLEKDGAAIDAARWRSRSRVMANGEPLLRATFKVGDRVFELDELPGGFSGRGDVLFERNRFALLRCELLTREGTSHAEAGRYEKALASFAAAMKADPFEPQPHYETAFTHLLHQRYDQAIESYERTHQLAPGWFQVRSQTWLARQLQAGRFHSTVPMALRHLEAAPPREGTELGGVLTGAFPDLPGAWALLADHLQKLGRAQDAEVAIRSGLACAEDIDVRTRLLVSLAALDNTRHRAELEEAAALNGNLTAGALARVLLVLNPDRQC